MEDNSAAVKKQATVRDRRAFRIFFKDKTRLTGTFTGTQQDLEDRFHVLSQDGNQVVVTGVKA